MNISTSKNFSAIILITFLLLSPRLMASGELFSRWYGNQNFTFNDSPDCLTVKIEKNPWESFTLRMDAEEFFSHPVVNFEVASDQDIRLRVDVSDGAFVSNEDMVIEHRVKGTGMFYKVQYDYSRLLSQIKPSDGIYLIFYVNPGRSFSGQIKVRNVDFAGTYKMDVAEGPDARNGFKLFPSPASTFTNITIPSEGYTTLRMLDGSGREILQRSITDFSGSVFRIDLSGIRKGYYLVQLFGDRGLLTQKLIVD